MTLQLYVSPDGNDGNEGTLEQPLATLEGALSRRGKSRRPCTVWLRGGVYKRVSPLKLDPADSKLIFRACPGEKVVIDGGAELDKWSKCVINGKKAWRAAIPAEVKPADIHQLFVNGKRKTRAAFPKNTFLRPDIPDYPVKDELFNGASSFRPRPGDFDPDWYDLRNIEVFIIHKWVEERMPLESFDADSGMLHCSRRSIFELNPEWTEYRFDNVREAMTEAGEWYCDSSAGCVYYLPEAGEDIDTATAVVPAAGCLVMFAGDQKHGKYIQHSGFEDIEFMHAGADSIFPTAHYPLAGLERPERNYAVRADWLGDCADKPLAAAPQGAVALPGVITMFGAKNCFIRNCRISRCGWYGIEISNGCDNIELSGNHLYDLGGGGIKAGGSGAMDDSPADAVSRCVITDNHLHDLGMVYYSAVGIILTHAKGCLVEHNHIHDLCYTGISCGWSWGYGPNASSENRIGFNLIHDLGKGILSDMGGIYLLGVQPGTRVYNNHIHHVSCRYYGGWGLYTDEGSSHMVLEDNICHDCSCEGFHQHFGRENIIRNNIFAFNSEDAVGMTSGYNRANSEYYFPGQNYRFNFSFYGNIIVSDGKPMFRAALKAIFKGQLYSDTNIFFDISGKPPVLAFCNEDKSTMSLRAWRKLGHDLRSQVGDPGFTACGQRDFSFKTGAMAIAKGFRPIDISHIGIRKPTR